MVFEDTVETNDVPGGYLNRLFLAHYVHDLYGYGLRLLLLEWHGIVLSRQRFAGLAALVSNGLRLLLLHSIMEGLSKSPRLQKSISLVSVKAEEPRRSVSRSRYGCKYPN
jgi:hypothetical protein